MNGFDEEWLNNYTRKRQAANKARNIKEPTATMQKDKSSQETVDGSPETSKKTESGGDKYRSKWESQYAHQLGYRKRAGEIRDWMHEPVKLKLHTVTETRKGKTRRKSIYYIPDFMIIHNDGSTEMVEVKGYERKAGELKYLQAVEKYNNFIWRKITKEKDVWLDMHYQGLNIDVTA